jgi:molecular chaperone GrpE
MKKEINNQEELFGQFWLSVKAVVYDESTEKVLVLKRSKKEKFHTGAYDLPGGHMDRGESIPECLQREIKDETGLTVEAGSILAVREYPKGHKMFDKIKALRFIAYYRGGEVELSEEHSTFEWLSFSEVTEKLASKKLSDGDRGYEEEKRDTILLAQKYLENNNSVEKWQRAIADFENYKRQTAKQNEEFKKYAAENVVVEILPVLDNFQSALDNIPEEEQGSGWVTGMTYIQKQLLDVLSGHGVEKMEVKIGDVFDANLHEAIKAREEVVPRGGANSDGRGGTSRSAESKVEKQGHSKAGLSERNDSEAKSLAFRSANNKDSSKGEKEKRTDTISKVVKNGYKIGEKVIRPAMVETN